MAAADKDGSTKTTCDPKLIEEIYELADCIEDTAESDNPMAKERRAWAIERLKDIVQSEQQSDIITPFVDPSHSWLLDVLLDLAEFAKQNGLEGTRTKLDECHAMVLLDLASHGRKTS